MHEFKWLCMCVYVMCMCVQHVTQELCLVCAWHWGTKKLKCVKHTPIYQNMSSMFNQKETLVLELIWVQFNTRMSLGHSVKHLTCNSEQHLWIMHEQDEICVNTWLECLMGPTQIRTQQMGLNPIKILKKNFTKIRTPTQFSKIPNF